MDTIQTFKNLLDIQKKKETVGFMDMVKTQLTRGENNVAYTANGAKVYRTSGKELLDLNFSVSAMRNAKEQEIYDKFMKAFYEDPVLAMKWLFYLRDTRSGIGERRSFRVIIKYLAEIRPELIRPLIPLFSEYGRYDDILVLMDTGLESVVLQFIKAQLIQDLKDMKENKPISLLAKWLPSVNANVVKTRELALKISQGIGLDEVTYRKTLSALRKYLKIVEIDMSAQKWSAIDYNKVPSKANLKYNSAFLRNDTARRREWLEKLALGTSDTKINASTIFPHEIINKYQKTATIIDNTLEELWKALPNTINGADNIMVVADGSSSMLSRVDCQHSTVSCLDVANALAIYFSEKCSGPYKNTYITFSERPKYVNFSKTKNLKEKIQIASAYCEVSNTDIQKVFELILDTALDNNLTQEELPNTILIISDMQFDSCVVGRGIHGRTYIANVNLFNYIQKTYEECGYKMPKCVFWNVCGNMRSTIPVTQNDMGVTLVSGFSPQIMKMVLSNEIDPYKALVKQLSVERYDAVEKIVKEVLNE